MNEQVTKTIDKIEDRIARGIVFNRVPSKTYDEFKKFADEEYCSDYGMALKHLWDFYKGIALCGNERLESGLQNHEERIVALESQLKALSEKKPEQKKEVKSLGGGVIR